MSDDVEKIIVRALGVVDDSKKEIKKVAFVVRLMSLMI